VSSFRPAVAFFLAAVASESQVGTFRALSAVISLLWGYSSQNFSSEEAAFIESFLL